NGGNKIPDDRYQLLWAPGSKAREKELTIQFYTSDISGEFEVSIQGFSNKGKPVAIKKTFYVN
ncbi:MAG: hypothetical protein QNJ57_10720, partial [Flavobacteriaceae bacterium]|nr:hypothetical protein [Flavobacteriaceae bacterium]